MPGFQTKVLFGSLAYQLYIRLPLTKAVLTGFFLSDLNRFLSLDEVLKETLNASDLNMTQKSKGAEVFYFFLLHRQQRRL